MWFCKLRISTNSSGFVANYFVQRENKRKNVSNPALSLLEKSNPTSS